MNPYDELGVEPSATPDQINAAYRRRAKAEHPDAGGDPTRFAALGCAVAILRDPQRRAEYDRTGSTEEPQGNSVQQGAAQLLCQAFQAAIDGVKQAGADLATIDIIEQVRVVLRANQNSLEGNRRNSLDEKRGTERNLARLKRKGGDGPDILGAMLRDKLAAITNGLGQMDHMEAVIKAAMEMAAGYDWEVDTVTMPWTPAAGATGYHIYRNHPFR